MQKLLEEDALASHQRKQVLKGRNKAILSKNMVDSSDRYQAKNKMATVKHLLILSLISIAMHMVVQLGLAFLSDLEYMQVNGFGYIIATMLAFVVLGYVLLRRWDNRFRPPFFQAFLVLFTAQLVTLLVLDAINMLALLLSIGVQHLPDTVSFSPDARDIIVRSLFFAVGLPLVILVIALLDRKKVG
jgi:cation transport ATPase